MASEWLTDAMMAKHFPSGMHGELVSHLIANLLHDPAFVDAVIRERVNTRAPAGFIEFVDYDDRWAEIPVANILAALGVTGGETTP